MSWRRLRVLIENLPPESAYGTSVRNALGPERLQEIASKQSDDKHGAWSQTDMLLARLGDLLAHAMWMQTDAKTPPPEPWPRPGVGVVSREIAPEVEAYLNEVRRLHGAQPSPEWWAALKEGGAHE